MTTIRSATLQDLGALTELENLCFSADRISRRQFRWLLQRGHCALLLCESEQQLEGYVLVLFHRGTALGRIYSLAIRPELRGRGIAGRLMQAAEAQALEHDCLALRLEVRPDNDAAIALYQRLGYRRFGAYQDYYADHSPALRFQKRLQPHGSTRLRPVVWYGQTLPFTCGPASLMMAMHALNTNLELNRTLELQLWREATSIFMTTGHGGCGPRGLALAAWRRGYEVELLINREGPLFTNGVRSAEKKAVLELVHQAFSRQIETAGIVEHLGEFTLDDLAREIDNGAYVLTLISSWVFSGQKSPHWVLLTGIDEHYVYLHDPDVDSDAAKVELDSQNVPVPRQHFWRMARFGKEQLRTAVVVKAYRGGTAPVN